NELGDDLIFLGSCRDYMKKIPEINLDTKTYIIAGMPNVGKSSLLTALTTAKPKIAPYPFTTKSIMIGYAEENEKKVQLIDTPGILDRDFSGMNDIEKNAILALKDINGTIIFLFDYSESSLYPPDVQDHLYTHIKTNINPRIIRVQTKADISEKIIEDIAITVNSEGGLDPIRRIIFS
ncbi:MAG: GTPase, partial [Thermoplasmata archaeon]